MPEGEIHEIRFELSAEEWELCRPWLDFSPHNDKIMSEITKDLLVQFIKDYSTESKEPQKYGFSHDYEMSPEGDGKV